MSEPRLLLAVREGVATVTLHRPDALNAIDDAMREEFPALVHRLEERDVRAVIITGSGRAFSAGGSVDHFEREWNTAEFRVHSHRLSAVFTRIEALEKPVIAALNGVATGAGLQLALACDLRFAATTAKLGYREHHLGLIPGHGGATRLVKLLGLSRAKGLYFRGDLVDAAEAREIGLVHRVLEPDDLLPETEREARMLAARAPASLGLAKQLLNRAADVDVATGLALESFAQSIAIGTQDHREGVRAFREKRPGTFTGD
ncbi:enoyl-CoA hydratase/isomerase family protein [bacterium]|nr:enoyl-CoA hydratase/isomerase family protein [bacterium]